MMEIVNVKIHDEGVSYFITRWNDKLWVVESLGSKIGREPISNV